MNAEEWGELKAQDPEVILSKLSTKNDIGQTYLRRSVSNSQMLSEMLAKIAVEDRLRLLSEQDGDGDTALMEAVKYPESLKSMLDKTPKSKLSDVLSVTDARGNTALVLAIQWNNGTMQMIFNKLNKKQLLKLLKIHNNDGHHALYSASCSSLTSILDYLDRSLACKLLTSRSKNGCTIIHDAAVYQNQKRLETLLRVIPKAEIVDMLSLCNNDGRSVICFSIHTGGKHLKLLLQAVRQKDLKTIMTKPNKSGWTTIASAACCDSKILQMILDTLDTPSKVYVLKSGVQTVQFEGWTALHFAAHYGLRDGVRVILEALDPVDRMSLLLTAGSRCRETPLHLSAANPETFKCIFEYSSIEDRLKMLQQKNRKDKSPILMFSMLRNSIMQLDEILELIKPEERFKLLTLSPTTKGCGINNKFHTTGRCMMPIHKILTKVREERTERFVHVCHAIAIFEKLQPFERFELLKVLQDPRDQEEGHECHFPCRIRTMALICILSLKDSFSAIKADVRHGIFKHENILHRLACDLRDPTENLKELLNLLSTGQRQELLCQKDSNGNTPVMVARSLAVKELLDSSDTTESRNYFTPFPPTVLIMYTTLDRDGAEDERRNLEKVLPEFEVEPIIKKDLSKSEMLEAIREVERRENISTLVVIIMTHGAKGIVHATDGPVAINDILLQLNPECLEGKPKVLLVQACQVSQDIVLRRHPRGSGEPAHISASSRSDARRADTVPDHFNIKHPDILVIIASVNGGVALRNLMIPHFAENLSKLTKDEDLYEVFLRTHNAVRMSSGYQQTAEFQSTFTQRLCPRNIFKAPPTPGLRARLLSWTQYWTINLLALFLVGILRIVAYAGSLTRFERPFARFFRGVERRLVPMLFRFLPKR